MKLTDYLKLKKPLSTEKYDVGIFNSNCDTLDHAVSELNHNLSDTNSIVDQRYQTTQQNIQTAKSELHTKIDHHIQNAEIHFTDAERQKLGAIEAGAQVNTVLGVKGAEENSYRTGNINISPAHIGADVKGSASKALENSKSYTDEIAATKMNLSQIDISNGVAPLDANRKIPSGNLPFGMEPGTCLEGSEGKKLFNSIETEVTRAKAAEQNIRNALNQETSRAQKAENTNRDAITSETIRATEAEFKNANAITAETTRAKAAEQSNSNAISAETTRATNAEKVNAGAISKESTRALAAEQSNSNAISAETTRAKAAEQSNSNAISAETTRAKAAEQSNSNAISAEQDRAAKAETTLTNNLNAEISRAKKEESSITQTIQSNKPVWDDKYTKNEIDNKFSTLETAIDWKESVATYSSLSTTYPNPQDGWTVNVKDTDYTYRWSGKHWIAISANAIPKATSSLDGLLSKEDKASYDDANAKKHVHSNKSVLDGITTSLVTAWNSSVTHISDAVKHITAAERTNWNDANSKKHSHSNKSILDGITQAIVDKWNAANLHTTAKNNPHGVTCSQVGASAYLPTYTILQNSDTSAYYKLFTITGTSTYATGVFSLAISNRQSNLCHMEFNISSGNDKYIVVDIVYDGNSFGSNIKGFAYKDTATGVTSVQIWCKVNAWEDIRFYPKTLNDRGYSIAWNLSKATAFPTNASSTILPSCKTWIGTAATATQATQDSVGQAIHTTYLKGLSVSGKTITYTKGNGSTGTITTQDTIYTHPTSSGNKHIPSGGSSGQILRWNANGTAVWAAENNTTYSLATQSANGLMSSTDKKKLDNVAAGAQVNSITGIKGNAETSYRTGNVNLTPGNIGASASNHTHKNILSAGRKTCTASSSTASATASEILNPGLSITETYNDSNAPASFGNIINVRGESSTGGGQLLLGWSGTDNTTDKVYYRSHRDTNTGGWGPWKQLAFTDSNVASATKATNDSNGNVITATYVKKGCTWNDLMG